MDALLQAALAETAELKGLVTAYIADGYHGTVLVSHQSTEVNRDGLGTHTAEVLRALTRLHSVLHQEQTDSSYFVSNSQHERIMVQQLSEGYYLAFVIHAKTNYPEAVAMFKQVFSKCQPILTASNTNRSSAAATAPSSQ